jgi:hypothetical protein
MVIFEDEDENEEDLRIAATWLAAIIPVWLSRKTSHEQTPHESRAF